MTLGPAYGDGGGGGGGGGAAVLDYIKVTESTTDKQLGGGTGAGTEVTIDWDTEAENTDSGNFSLASEIITVADAGEYRIEYMVAVKPGADQNPRGLRISVQVDPDTTTYVDVFDSFSFIDQRSSDSSTGAYGEVQLTLVAASLVRIRIIRNLGTQTTNVNHALSSFTITKIG